jgi:hypothetical protein
MPAPGGGMNLDARDVVVTVAREMTWVREVGANRGQAVEAILKRVGLAPGLPWCAAFVAYVGRSACGAKWPLPMVGGCATLGERAERLGMLREKPANGAIFLLWGEKQGRYNHTGFVTAVSNPFYTVEGNTSPDGSPEGTGVFERRRTAQPLDRFIHWWEP